MSNIPEVDLLVKKARSLGTNARLMFRGYAPYAVPVVGGIAGGTEGYHNHEDDIEVSDKQNKINRASAAVIGGVLGAYSGSAIAGIARDMNSVRRVHAFERKNLGSKWEQRKAYGSKTYTGHGGESEGGGSYRQRYRRSTRAPGVSAHEEFFTNHAPDVDYKNFKTKAEVKSHFRKVRSKYHPDRFQEGSPEWHHATETLKKVNPLIDEIEKSSWFEKLAFVITSDFIKEAMVHLRKQKFYPG